MNARAECIAAAVVAAVGLAGCTDGASAGEPSTRILKQVKAELAARPEGLRLVGREA